MLDASEVKKRQTLYESLVEKAQSSEIQSRPDDALFWAHTAARLAYEYPLGMWSDPRLESIAFKIGNKLSRCLVGDQALVHVVSGILDGGGHSEVLRQWTEIINGWDHHQHVISSELEDSSRAEQLAAIRGQVETVSLAPHKMTPTERTRWIHEEIYKTQPQSIILHIHPYDVCSLAATQGFIKAQTFYFNHADHGFTLGQSSANRTIQYRTASAPFALLSQGANQISYVPLGSRERTSTPVTRRDLGIPDGATVSITVGALYKCKPNESWHFGKALREILTEDHWHLFVGYPNPEVSEAILSQIPKQLCARVLWLGRRMDLDQLFKLSDFLIDSFPMVGGQVKLDAMREGLPIVAVTNEAMWPFCDLGILDDYELTADSMPEVVRSSQLLRDNPERRRTVGDALKRIYEAEHSKQIVEKALKRALFGLPETVALTAQSSDRAADASAYFASLTPGCGPLRLLEFKSESELGWRPNRTRSRRLYLKVRSLAARLKGAI